MVLFIVCTFFVVFFSYVIAKSTACDSDDTKVNVILRTSILSIAIILGITFTLGFMLGRYNKTNIIIISFLLFVCSLLLVFISKSKFTLKKHDSSPLFSDFSKSEKFVAIVIFISILYKLLSIFLLRMNDWDGVAYHIPNLVDYIQNQKIGLVEKSLWSNVYPRNIEMLNMWALIFRRDTLLIKLPQFFITLMGSCAVFGILKNCNFSRKNCLFGTMIFLSTPIVLAQMSTTYVDSALASLVFVCIYFMLEYEKAPSFNLAIFIGLTLGIIVGVKYSALAYTAILAIAFIVITLKKNRNKSGFAKILVVAAVSLSIGCVWYVFNWINFGNPFAPFEISLGNLVFFKGESVSALVMEQNIPETLSGKNPIIQIFTSWLEYYPKKKDFFADGIVFRKVIQEFRTGADDRIGGFGINWLLIMFPSIILSLWQMIKEKKYNGSVILVFTISFLMFFVTPENWWTRYSLPFLIAGIVGYIFLLNDGCVKKYIQTAFIIIMCINCASGLCDDVYYVFANLNSNASAREKLLKLDLLGFRSTQYPTEFAKNVAGFINDGSYRIVSFLPLANNELTFQGDSTQNIYHWYGPGEFYSPAIEGFNLIKQEKWFNYILDTENPDFILLHRHYVTDYYTFFNEYNSAGKYDLIYTYEDNLLYRKVSD